MTSPLRLKPVDFKVGDRLPSGSTIVGYVARVKGGTKFTVRTGDGHPKDIVFDGRRTYLIERRAQMTTITTTTPTSADIEKARDQFGGVFPTPDAIGRLAAIITGVYSRKGGWIYRREQNGREWPICHGWASYGHSWGLKYVPERKGWVIGSNGRRRLEDRADAAIIRTCAEEANTAHAQRCTDDQLATIVRTFRSSVEGTSNWRWVQACKAEQERRAANDAAGGWECYGCGHHVRALTEGFNTRCPKCGSFELHLSDAAEAKAR